MAESGLILKAVLGNELCKILLGARGHKTGTALLGKNALTVRRSLPLPPSNLLSIGHNEIWHFGDNQVEQLIRKKFQNFHLVSQKHSLHQFILPLKTGGESLRPVLKTFVLKP